MNALKRQLAIGCTTLVSLPLAGCLERKETITVTQDGRVKMEFKYKGDPADFEGGDAMPSEAVMDRIAINREVNNDGDEEVNLEAERSFEPGEMLLDSFAVAGGPDGDLYLRFPTSLTMERRDGGTYYHFARTYEARPWAYVQYWQDFIMQGDTQKLADKPVEELTLDERVELIRSFAGIEAFKQVEFAKAALAECAPGLPQHHWLMARQNLLHVFAADGMLPDKRTLDLFGHGDYLDSLVARCDALADGERDACYEQEAERVLSLSYQALVQSLRDNAGFKDADVAAFDRAYVRAQRRYEITNLLGGHHFEVCVKMPGRIIAHNADDVEDLDEETGIGTEACWGMEGKGVRDRQFEMMVTSFVPASRSGK